MANVARALVALCVVGCGLAPAAANPVELRYLCYGDGDECEVTRDLLEPFHAANPDIRVVVDKVSFTVIREQLEARLSAGAGPDMARVTNLGGLNPHYLDIGPHVDAALWERAFGPSLQGLRNGTADRGIYGFPTQMTVSGAFVNRTLFERAGVPMPGRGATWDEWARSVDLVRRRLSLYSGIAFDRSGHRFAQGALSYGARFVDGDGRLSALDAGFRAFATRMIEWHRTEVMPRDIWPAVSGARLRSGADMFINGDAVMHVAGSWQVQRYAEAIGRRFDWVVIPTPCGTSGCFAMPGGAAMVAFRRTAHPSAVARVMGYLASEPVMRVFFARTFQLSAHRDIPGESLDYGPSAPPAAVAAMRSFADIARDVPPAAHALQAHPRNHILFNAIADHLTQAITGRVSLDDAMRRIDAEVARAGR